MRNYFWPIAWLTLGMFIFISAIMVAFSAGAQARPTCNPYNTQASGAGGAFGGYGEYCDEFPVNDAGDHFHCEYGGFIGYGGSCSWRNSSNQVIAPPPEARR